MAEQNPSIQSAAKPSNPKFIDLEGRRYGRLTVLAYAGRFGAVLHFHWHCRCDCGNLTKVEGADLRGGHTKSCGCLRNDLVRERQSKHGKKIGGTPENRAYHNAKDRCNNPRNHVYSSYGGRGIEFRFTSFEEFLAEVGRRPSRKLSLNRIDNDGHYEKGNVEWATATEQARNRRCSKR